MTTLLRVSRRAFSSFRLPPPTWSVKSLGLDRDHAPIDKEELAVLAKRSLLLVDDDDDMRQQVGNMQHLLEQVVMEGSEDKSYDVEQLYDAPRNVSEAPVRRSSTDHSTDDDEATSENVYESLLKPKTTRVGGHSYFEIVTRK